jgi:hypothetical protein
MLPLDYDTNLRYNELLKEAETERLAKRVSAGKSGIQARTLQGLGDTLISLGKSLKSLSLSL